MKIKRLSFYLRLVSIVFLVLTLSAALTWGRSKDENGGAFIPFTLKTFDGRALDLNSLIGKPIVINFFASWCTGCKAEAGAFGREYLAFKEAGVEFVGVAVQDRGEDAKEFMKKFGLTYPAGLDDTGEIAKKYKVYGIPKTFIVGKDGRFSFIHTGALTEEELVREIKKAL